MFETIEGGFLDIDVRIVGPDGKIIYQVRIGVFVMKLELKLNCENFREIARQTENIRSQPTRQASTHIASATRCRL